MTESVKIVNALTNPFRKDASYSRNAFLTLGGGKALTMIGASSPGHRLTIAWPHRP